MNKIIFLITLLLFTLNGLAQKTSYYTNDDVIADGYDVVSYFNNRAEEGSEKYSHEHDGVKYHFKNQQNLETFKANPDKYIPQYGGWCAYAVASYSGRVKINPKTFEIRDGKLYLFYDFFFNNTFKSWKKEGPEQLIKQGDKNWRKMNL